MYALPYMSAKMSASEKPGNVQPNCFTSTLGQAAERPDTNLSTVSELIDLQAKCHGDRFACAFPTPRDGVEWSCDIFSSDFPSLQGASHCLDSGGRGAYSTLNNSVDFLFTWLGLMRAGLSVLLIAPQCQPEAIVHLCKSCDALHLVYDEAYRDLASSAASHAESLAIHQIPWQSQSHDIRHLMSHLKPFRRIVSEAVESDTAYIHHTSGTSSGMPKPIPQTHHGAVSVLPSFDGGDSATFTTTPLYHGGIADCFRAWTSNALIWLFPGDKRPITTNNILFCLNVSEKAAQERSTPQVKYFSSVPYVLQMLAEDPQGVSMLQKMDIVGVGGAALPAGVGDDLVSSEVNLVSRFGSAECGFLLCSHRDYETDKEWQYLRLASTKLLQFEKQDDDSGLYELVVRPDWPHMAKRNRQDGSYATSDLFEPHPTILNAWKYHSRSDNQITLLTGKKFDPAPLEDEIASSSPHIREVFIVGNGKQVPGALVILKSDMSACREKEIWDVVKNINGKGENHTRISRGMILILDAKTPQLSRSSKGTLLRALVEKRFAMEIEQLYTVSDSENFTETVNGLLERPMKDEYCDFYRSGVDSATCTQIRSVLQKKILGRGELLPWNVVYNCGNIQNLSQYINDLRGGSLNDSKTSSGVEQQMLDLVRRCSNFETSEEPDDVVKRQNPEPYTRVVIFTGATGALGAHILDILRRDRSITEIYSLVRAVDQNAARTRVSSSLIKRRKDSLQDHDNVQCIPVRLAQPDLGIPAELLEVLRSKVTHIIHAAWTVNFSLPLQAFEEDNIAGLYHLIKFSKSCSPPARLSFCSSTASVLGQSHPAVITEQISTSPSDANALGYSRSKWVAEAICSAASNEEMMAGRIKILRIGQLTGDTVNGVWNMSEAWPMMLSTVDAVNCLPQRGDKLTWLPVDIAAQAVIDIALGESTDNPPTKDCPVYHIVNNSTEKSWEDLLRWIREARSKPFGVVEPDEWMKSLEKLESHPAQSLLWLWKGSSAEEENNDNREKQQARFEVANAEEFSKAMRSVRPVDKELIHKIWNWLEEQMIGSNESPEDKAL
ncbi:acetyl-CoA synthetase-like protein [Mollisia scopiformis]|uniref:Acetyl-CoA synthetase-like protein n=1 Tax=Mollisia scopiformis TaxID=149040 RepID=A0A194XN36_MOLSC|nr:acetyl-CoA synthetase-like protein [Mollisia scopiformis]KUJ21541.1 acetyl-CoA synthetase-like protein [Mollisia scopiformis]